MDLLESAAFKCSVSSVLNKDVKQHGKQFMFDKEEDTSWSSDQGSPQWILLQFEEPQVLSGFSFQFQGGFVGNNATISLEAKDGSVISKEPFYPEDINSMQKFALKTYLNEKNITKILILKEMESTFKSIDKIMQQFNDSITHSAPKKLDFGSFSDSLLNESSGVKRKRYDSDKVEILNGSHNVSQNSTVQSSNLSKNPPPSPWEARRIKADLIDAQMRIIKLREEIERQQKIYKEKEVDYEAKITELKHQYKFANNKAEDIEKHLQTVRKREQIAQQDVEKLKKNLIQQKQKYEDALMEVQRQKYEAEEHAIQVETSLTQELSDCRRRAERLEMEYDATCEEIEHLKNLLDDYKDRADAYDELNLKHEQEHSDLEMAKLRIKELEYQLENLNEMKRLTESSEKNLLKMPELNEELDRLRSSNKSLRDFLGNKLLLQERVKTLESDLEKYEQTRNELVALQVKLANTEHELRDYVKIAQDHCPPNTLVSPMMLRTRIEELLQKELIFASEKSSQSSNTKTLEQRLQDYKQKAEIYSKNIEELNVALKRHKTFTDRARVKLVLVSKERDCYKQLLDSFEKDLTVSNMNAPEVSNTETQMRMRIDMLEKALTGYKEMCINLERELENCRKAGESDHNRAIEGEGYGYYGKELETLRLENQRLQQRKQELEMELEHARMRINLGTQSQKILHLTENPASEAYKTNNDIIEKLQAEIERLKRRNKQLETDNEATQARLNETQNMTINIKEINQLRAELESCNAKTKKIKEAYKSASMEFREVCYMLFGYKVDRLGTGQHYKIFSMFAESPDDYLNFRLNESSVLELLETPYSLTLRPLMEKHLVGSDSLPVFLSSLTLELFQRATVTID